MCIVGCEAVMSNWLFRSTGELGGPPIYCFVMMSDSSCWCFDCMLAIPLIHTKFKYFFCCISNTCLAGAHSWEHPNTRGGQVEKVSPYCHAGHWRKGLSQKRYQVPIWHHLDTRMYILNQKLAKKRKQTCLWNACVGVSQVKTHKFMHLLFTPTQLPTSETICMLWQLGSGLL